MVVDQWNWCAHTGEMDTWKRLALGVGENAHEYGGWREVVDMGHMDHMDHTDHKDHMDHRDHMNHRDHTNHMDHRDHTDHKDHMEHM